MCWIQTFKGHKFYPFGSPDNILDIEDISHSLSLICRYNGHSSEFYSVADHCIRVSEIVSNENKLWGLLHDAAEAYLGDICNPVKPYFKILDSEYEDAVDFKEVENALLYDIAYKFKLKWYSFDGIPDEVKNADKILAATEKRDLMVSGPKWADMPKPLLDKIVPRSPEDSEKKFLEDFYLLSNSLYHTGQRRILT